MDETTWQKAFNAGRAYQVLAKLRVSMSQYAFDEGTKEDKDADFCDLTRLCDDAMLLLKSEE